MRSIRQKMTRRPSKEIWTRHLRLLTASVVSILILTGVLYPKPDLTVSKIVMTRGGDGIFVDKVLVTVTNDCDDASGPSHLQITFKDTAEPMSKPIYFQISGVGSLRGGHSHTLTFNVLEKRIILGRYLIAEVDTFKKVDEAREYNNWRTLFPEENPRRVEHSGCR